MEQLNSTTSKSTNLSEALTECWVLRAINNNNRNPSNSFFTVAESCDLCTDTFTKQHYSQEDVSTSIIQPRKLVEDSSVAKSSQSSQSLSTKENVPSNLQQVVGQEQLNKFSEQCRKTHELESSLSASKGNSLVHKKKLELETRPGW